MGKCANLELMLVLIFADNDGTIKPKLSGRKSMTFFSSHAYVWQVIDLLAGQWQCPGKHKSANKVTFACYLEGV